MGVLHFSEPNFSIYLTNSFYILMVIYKKKNKTNFHFMCQTAKIKMTDLRQQIEMI